MTGPPLHSGPEIRLNVTDRDSTEAPPGKPPSKVWTWLFATRLRTLVTSAIVLALLVSVGIGADHHDRASKAEPVKAMESFLRALQDGDINEAHTYVPNGTVEYHHDFTLDPTIYSSEWNIGEIELVDFQRVGDRNVTVSAQILAHDGTGVTEEFQMQQQDDRWVVANPYSDSVRVSNNTFKGLQINGRAPETPSSSELSWFYVLPGAYEMGLPEVELVEPQYQTVLMLGNQYSLADPTVSTAFPVVNGQDSITLSLFALADNADDLAQSRVNEYLNDCTTSELNAPGCPIDGHVSHDLLDHGEPFSPAVEISWTVLEFPEVSTIFHPGTSTDSWLGFENQTPGIAELTIHNLDDGPSSLTFRCSIGLTFLEPVIGSDGKLYIGPLQDPQETMDDLYGHRVQDMTCDKVE